MFSENPNPDKSKPKRLTAKIAKTAKTAKSAKIF